MQQVADARGVVAAIAAILVAIVVLGRAHTAHA
jgi:hypothetical protein